MHRIVFLFAFPLAAAAQGPGTASLLSNPFAESYQPEVSVSGNVIVGIMLGAASAAVVEDAIAVNATARRGEGFICLEAASRDGIYTSKNEYQVPSEAAGLVRLPYRSQLGDVLREYASERLALLASAGRCDSGSSDYYLVRPSSLGATEDVVIFINSFGATDVFYALDGDADVSACEYISQGRRTTYDFVCRPRISSTAETIDITILRERFGREQPSVGLTIIGAGE